jgi:ribosomal protein S18 acetylase RimI-like enzyme
VVGLVLAEDAAWSGAPSVSAEEAGEFVDSFPLGVVVGDWAGYAAVGEGGQLLLLDPAQDPAPALEVLVGWLAAQGRHEIDAYAADVRRIAWLTERGFAHRRSMFDLVRGVEPRPAAPAWPPGIGVRAFEQDVDVEAIHRLVYVDAAWTEVPGHHERSLEGWRARNDRGWVAERDRRPVGWASVRQFGDGRGVVEQLAVARDHRGLGIGRALLLHSLADLGAQGASSFALGVQGANANAIDLYRNVGFEVEREWRVYAR